MIIKKLVVGQLETNCYILKHEDSREAVVIDPGADLIVIKDELYKLDAMCRVVLLTHGHFDHIFEADNLRNSRTEVCIHKEDASMLTERDTFSPILPYDPRPLMPADVLFDKEGMYTVAGYEFYVIPTPGHTDGSVCYVFDDIMFTGDTLFCRSMGRTDMPSGNEEKMGETMRMLYRMPADYAVYPGHGRTTTLSDEKKYNDYMLYHNSKL